MTTMDLSLAICVDCAEAGAAIELASGQGLVCARCFARRSEAAKRGSHVPGRGVRWTDAERLAWRETAELSGQSAMAAECVGNALAGRGISYRASGRWVLQHGPAYADLCVACGSSTRHTDDDVTMLGRWVAEDERSPHPRSADSARR